MLLNYMKGQLEYLYQVILKLKISSALAHHPVILAGWSEMFLQDRMDRKPCFFPENLQRTPGIGMVCAAPDVVCRKQTMVCSRQTRVSQRLTWESSPMFKRSALPFVVRSSKRNTWVWGGMGIVVNSGRLTSRISPDMLAPYRPWISD